MTSRRDGASDKWPVAPPMSLASSGRCGFPTAKENWRTASVCPSGGVVDEEFVKLERWVLIGVTLESEAPCGPLIDMPGANPFEAPVRRALEIVSSRV